MIEDQAPASVETDTATVTPPMEPKINDDGPAQVNISEQTEMNSEETSNKEVPMSPPASKPVLPKPIEAVYYEPEAYASLLAFSGGLRPAIGILHGSFLDQGAALINRISLLPRNIKSLCAWKVTPSKDVDTSYLFDGIGVICFDSNEAVFSYAVEEALALLPLKNQWILVRSYMFINDEDVLVTKVICNLHSMESKNDPKPLSMYQVPEVSLPRANFNLTFASEFQQCQTILHDKLSNFMRIQSELLLAENNMQEGLQLDAMRLNEQNRFDQTLLGLKRAIHRRIVDLEKVWATKKSRTESKEDRVVSVSELSRTQDVRFINLIGQLANRDLLGSHASLLEIRPNNNVIPDRFESIFVRTTRNPQPSTKKKPSASKPKVPKPSPAEPISTVDNGTETQQATSTTTSNTDINVVVDETAASAL